MKRFINAHKKALAAVAAVAVIAGTGIGAYAYVQETSHVNATGGTGTVTPSTGTVANLTWSAGTATGLIPGGSAQNVTITLSNSNPYSVNIQAWKFAVSSVSGPAGCLTNAVALLSGSATTTAPFIVPAGGTNTVTVPVSMADSTTIDQGPCISSPLTVTFAATDQNVSDTNN